MKIQIRKAAAWEKSILKLKDFQVPRKTPKLWHVSKVLEIRKEKGIQQKSLR